MKELVQKDVTKKVKEYLKKVFPGKKLMPYTSLNVYESYGFKGLEIRIDEQPTEVFYQIMWKS